MDDLASADRAPRLRRLARQRIAAGDHQQQFVLHDEMRLQAFEIAQRHADDDVLLTELTVDAGADAMCNTVDPVSHPARRQYP
ncbi:hypothetical protein [Sphingomonas sp. R86520]|uniref:hypothetical protein n=1 Tax=Sphingomonas sp. R86520 TaxID=3093859 RepID=UPI0036D43CBA